MLTKSTPRLLSLTALLAMIVFVFGIPGQCFTALGTDQIRFRNIGLNQGLPGSSVFAIHQDRYGFLWIGTREGLVRYDGREIKNLSYLSDENIDLNGKMITAVFEDAQGNLFIGVWDHGLYYYDRPKGKLSKIRIETSVGLSESPTHVWSVAGDHAGNLYVATIGQGLFQLPAGSSMLTPFPDKTSQDITGTNIYAMLITDNRFIWLASSDKGLNRLNLTDGSVMPVVFDTNGFIPLQIRAMYVDQDGIIWVGTQGQGLYQLKQGSIQLVKTSILGSALDEARIRAIQSDETGRLWIGTDGDGVIILDPNSLNAQNLRFTASEEGSLSSNVVFTIFRGADNKIWLGTNKAGVDIWQPENQRILRKTNWAGYNEVRQNMVLSVLEGKDNTIWIGTDGNGLYRLLPDRQKFIKDQYLQGLAVKAIYEHKDGSLLFGTYGNGMWMRQADGKKWHHFIHQPDNTFSLCQNDVWAFAAATDGGIWVATLNGGLCLFDPEQLKFKKTGFEDEVFTQLPLNILTLETDTTGCLWVGTSKGLYQLRQIEDKTLLNRVNTETHPGLESAEIKSLMIDRKQQIWVGTRGNGLYCIDLQGNVLKKLTVADGLASNTIASVMEDTNNFIWIAAAGRLSRLRSDFSQLIHFEKEDGLAVAEYLSESAVVLHSGELLFGGVYGLDWVDPESVKLNQQLSDVFFTKLLVMNEEVVPSLKGGVLQSDIGFQTSIRLMHYENTFSLEFTALNFDFPDRSSFAYKLEGFDVQWNYIGNQRKITFTNLDPGNYVLRVIAANADGIWNEHGASLEIIVVPPWWNTRLAKFAFALLGISLVVYLIVRRINAELKRRQELERLVASRTHDLEEEKKRVEGRNFELIKAREELISQNREILKQQDEIKSISTKLHEADKRKLDFFTGISHEIRTPLTLMINPVNQLIKEYSRHDEKLVKQLRTVQRNQHNLLGLVNQLLDFQKIDNDQLKLQAFPLPLADIVFEVLTDFEERIQSSDLIVEIDVPDRIAEAWIDPLQFKKVINNLISNAVKFTPAGGTINISISEHDNGANGFIQIEITDTGIGIAADDLERVFDSFFQSKGPKPQANTGTGIGLSIARSIVQLHKGKIFARPYMTTGASFVIQLPKGKDHLNANEMMISIPKPHDDKPSEVEVNESVDISEHSAITPTRHRVLPRILIVEDNMDLQLFLANSFSSDNQVIVASDGAKGLKAALQYQPDLIISDIIMPIMDGIEMLNQLKHDSRTNHIPIILLSAKTLLQQRLEGLMAGADEYLAKPFTFEELNARATNLIKNRMLIREKFRLDSQEIEESLRLVSADDELLQRLYVLLEESYTNEEFGAAQLLKGAGISRSGLHTRLKKLTGMSVTEFIRSFRLRKAAVLLQQNQLTVAEIAFKSGFSDVSYFNRCFRRQFGTSPGQYASEMAAGVSDLNINPNDLNISPTH